MTDNHLNIGAIGTGGIFKGPHANAWEAIDEASVVALCDIKPEKCKPVQERFGVGDDRVFADFNELVKLDEIDAVDICTPNLFHSHAAVAALEAGKHVFCEKPDAVNADEAQRMADAAKASGKTLMVMRNNRFRPDIGWLKRYIDEGSMGEVYTGRCGWLRRRGIPGKGGWFTTKELSGGGPLIDLGVHMLDVAIWLMGDPTPVAVTGCTYRKFAEASGPADSVHATFGEADADGTFDVEDLAIGFIRFDNGASLQVECSWASNVEKEGTFVELRGTKAGASVGHGDFKVFTESGGSAVDLHPKPPKPKPGFGGHASHLRHFVDVVLHDAPPINVPQDGVNMIKILTALYQSAATGKEVRLD